MSSAIEIEAAAVRAPNDWDHGGTQNDYGVATFRLNAVSRILPCPDWLAGGGRYVCVRNKAGVKAYFGFSINSDSVIDSTVVGTSATMETASCGKEMAVGSERDYYVPRTPNQNSKDTVYFVGETISSTSTTMEVTLVGGKVL